MRPPGNGRDHGTGIQFVQEKMNEVNGCLFLFVPKMRGFAPPVRVQNAVQ